MRKDMKQNMKLNTSYRKVKILLKCMKRSKKTKTQTSISEDSLPV